MEVLLIDPYTRSIQNVVCEASLDALRWIIGCDVLEAVPFDSAHDVWVDEDGLRVSDALGPGRAAYFVLSGLGGIHLIGGKAVIAGRGKAGPTDADVSVTQIDARVSFPKDQRRAFDVARTILDRGVMFIGSVDALATARQRALEDRHRILSLLAS